jgi:2-dehydro-3-deoxyphosphooctonate aldolase (KDO 8-P synthase)
MATPLWKSNKLLIIAGPCTLESRELALQVAGKLSELQSAYPKIQFIFKASFDKANRTSASSRRGLGIETCLKIFEEVKQQFSLPVLTDIHLPEQATQLATVCDVLQIPAFLCRQTDLLQAAAETGRVVNVKKGQFLSPNEIEFIINKLVSFQCKEMWLTERGFSFGYQNLVVDMRSFPIMRKWSESLIFDATHSVQLPGAAGGKSGGQREFALPLAKAALAAGANGLFIETHPNPDEAWSDGPNMVPLHELESFICSALNVWCAANANP